MRVVDLAAAFLAAVTACLSVGVACFAAPVLPIPALARYGVTDMGALPNLAGEATPRINTQGQVSLWMTTATGTVHAGLWAAGRTADLGSPEGYPNSVACAVDDAGSVVGWANTSRNPVDSLSTTRGCWYGGGRVHVLDTLGGRDSQALATNAAGWIVGVASRTPTERHAFLFRAGAMTDLGVLAGGSFSSAQAVNAWGDIAGVSDTRLGTKHAVLWRGRQAVDLGTLPGGRTSSAQAINGRDEVVGYSEMAEGYHAFLYSAGRMRDLGTLGAEPSSASGINDRGQAVGTSNVSPYQRHACLWNDGKAVDLNSLLPDGGWTLDLGYDINNRGQIVCAGHRKGGARHALLLTPL